MRTGRLRCRFFLLRVFPPSSYYAFATYTYFNACHVQPQTDSVAKLRVNSLNCLIKFQLREVKSFRLRIQCGPGHET